MDLVVIGHKNHVLFPVGRGAMRVVSSRQMIMDLISGEAIDLTSYMHNIMMDLVDLVSC